MIEMPRNTPKAVYKYFRRLERCNMRAMRETGNFDKFYGDVMLRGTGCYTAQMTKQDADRTMELMRGLKPHGN